MQTHDDQPGIDVVLSFTFRSQLNCQHDLVLPYAKRVYGSILCQPKHARPLCNAKLDSICREQNAVKGLDKTVTEACQAACVAYQCIYASNVSHKAWAKHSSAQTLDNFTKFQSLHKM